MIVTPDGDSLRLVTQSDHAWLSAEILSLWRRDGLPDHPRRSELLLAVREHDNGWRESDAAPRLADDSGRPHDFRSLPLTDRLEIWRRGAARLRAAAPFAASLILRHACELHRDRSEPEWVEQIEIWRRDAAEISEQEGIGEAEVSAAYPLLELADSLSLWLCNGWVEPLECHGYSGRLAGATLHLEPFPLAGATTFRIPYRRLPRRPYRSDVELAVALATARWDDLALRLAPTPAASL